MLGNYKRKIKLLNDLNLSNEEFDFLYMVQLYQNDRMLKDSEFIQDFSLYVEINKSKFDYIKLVKLAEEKGYLINLNQKDDLKIELLKISDRFKSIFIMDIDVMWRKVIEMYPKFMIINDRPAPLHGITNPNIKQYYFTTITGGGDKAQHEEFISLLEYYYGGEKHTTYKASAMKLEKFIYSWESIKLMVLDEMKNKDPNQLKFNYAY